MSLDIYLHGEEVETDCECSACGHTHKAVERPTLFTRNITHNLNTMANAAGIYDALWRPAEHGVKVASQLIPILTEGLRRLEEDPEKFEKFNPPNKWGSYDGLVVFVRDYLSACMKHPTATVRVWR